MNTEPRTLDLTYLEEAVELGLSVRRGHPSWAPPETRTPLQEIHLPLPESLNRIRELQRVLWPVEGEAAA